MLASMVFKSADSTELMNGITKNILPAGVYYFPGDPQVANDWIIPGTGLQVIIKAPWVVRNIDGMTIREIIPYDSRVTFPDQGEYYVGLFSKYIISSDPILELRYISIADYLTWVEKGYFVIFAKVTITAPQVTLPMIDIGARRRPRGVFALTEDLLNLGAIVRLATNVTNFPPNPRLNEIVYVQSENAFYKYNGNGDWVRVDAPFTGISTFNSTLGRVIQLPHLMVNRPYVVNVAPVQNGGGSVGDWWIERDLTFFTIYNTGIATTQFSWHVVPVVDPNFIP